METMAQKATLEAQAEAALDQAARKLRRWAKSGRGPGVRPEKEQLTRTAYVYHCRICRSRGSLVSLEPAKGYACSGCAQKYGKDAIIAAASRADIEAHQAQKMGRNGNEK